VKFAGADILGSPSILAVRIYLTHNVFTAVFKKSIPAKIRQFILYISKYESQVDGFVRELTFAKRIYTRFM
jgi:hypothetical protein